jgi:hypothetical protein
LFHVRYLPTDAAAACASLSFCPHSTQHTSTVLPPMVTAIACSSKRQSHAAHVFSAIVLPPEASNELETSVGHAAEDRRYQDL